MSLILKHEQHKFEGDGFFSALTSLIPKVANFVSNNKSLISSEAQALGSVAKAGIQKSLGSLPEFPWAKYPGEKHLPGHNYTGSGTRLDLRLDENDKPKPGEEPVNRVDAVALKHDILYRNKDITSRDEADRQMIIEL
ncbi:hypothetical protein LOTGIDRAFT_170824 [Lottia gigantea]|uniref:Phospholipase A2-like domain-containing protein n=1 Tax=Lottia gigantea TaxID=225164 RepID=V4BAD8_LOTGI|nr:hypothetical protein LOTGIDRAFT_170824 [Lottia gigantea]ESP04431.1 hypothetical protein LOTGIDRAFT_170824 [Lottia gigantea]